MFGSVLIICVGNICRSPMGERMLRAQLPRHKILSAGLGAVVGSPADETAVRVAAEVGIDLGGHVARQLTAELGAAYELILVMETGQRAEIGRVFPQLFGRTFLFDQWTGGHDILDPYRKSAEFYRQTRDRISDASVAWAVRLNK